MTDKKDLIVKFSVEIGTKGSYGFSEMFRFKREESGLLSPNEAVTSVTRYMEELGAKLDAFEEQKADGSED